MREAETLRAIRLDLGREPDLVLWRLGQGVTVDRKTGKRYRAGLVPGAADLIGILTIEKMGCGVFFSLEVKAPKGRPSEEQKRWGALVQSRGGFWSVVRSVDEARRALRRARNGENG